MNWYCCANRLAGNITSYQSHIDALTTTAGDLEGASANKASVISSCTGYTTQINNLYRTANYYEILALSDDQDKGRIRVLKNDFNQALAALSVGANDPRVAP